MTLVRDKIEYQYEYGVQWFWHSVVHYTDILMNLG
jgi:hypothetical protein